jgi:hypothetical protein
MDVKRDVEGRSVRQGKERIMRVETYTETA